MGFDFNPLRHIEVTLADDGGYRLYCHGCGCQFGGYVNGTPVETLFLGMRRHVEQSHGRTDKDFEGWWIT